MESKGYILVNNDISFLSIPSAWAQEPMICQFLGIIVYTGVYVAFPHTVTRLHQCSKFNGIKIYWFSYMSHLSYACKMRYPLNLVLENWEYL